MNEAMKLERENFLGASSYERTEGRNGYANGFKPKTLNMRSGQVTLAIPQTRNCDFYPQSLTKGLRSERALTIAMAEMYVQGVSTRKVKNVLENMCGLSVSSSQVSAAAAQMDDEIWLFKERLLGEYPVIHIDAEYQIVRMNGSVTDVAVLQAIGVNKSGKREVIGMSVSNSEAEIHWRTFLTSLVNRGLCGVKLIVSDDHAGHLFPAEQGRHHHGFAWGDQVLGVFPNPESCERLIGSILMEQHEEWMTDKAYLTGKGSKNSTMCA